MGAVVDPAAEKTAQVIDAAEEGDANPSVDGARAGTVTDPTAAGPRARTVTDPTAAVSSMVSGAGKPIEFSPAAPPRIYRGASGGIFRGLSGGIHRGASGGGGTGPHRSASAGGGIGPPRSASGGGIYRGRSGGIHLPSLASFSISMSRLPEEDAGVQMHLTKTEEVEDDALDSPRLVTGGGGGGGGGDGDDEAAPPRRKKSRLRKHLTVVGACSFGFRLAETVLSLIAIVVMCSNSQHMGADVGTLRFNHFQAYRYLVAVNVCVFVYSTLQFIQLAYTVILGISFIPSILFSTWLTFGFDQLFAYLLLSASTSAATVANMSYTGELGMRLCSRYDVGSFCARADAAVTMSFFTFVAMLSSAILAIYRVAVLLKEY